MDQSNQDRHEHRVLSRRGMVKGGLAAAAGAVATAMAVRNGTAALTPLDVKKPGFSAFSVDPVSSVESTKGNGKGK